MWLHGNKNDIDTGIYLNYLKNILLDIYFYYNFFKILYTKSHNLHTNWSLSFLVILEIIIIILNRSNLQKYKKNFKYLIFLVDSSLY